MASPNSTSVKVSNYILTSFVHAPHGPGEKLSLSSRTKADNNQTELGLTGDDGVSEGSKSCVPTAVSMYSTRRLFSK